MLQAGDIAPDFKIPVLIGGVRKEFRLAEHRGKRNLVLAFYPDNWDAVSTQQMINYQVEREKFQARQAEVLGISVDSIMNTTSWEREIGPFDFLAGQRFLAARRSQPPLRRIAGKLRPFEGASERAILVVDKSGQVRFAERIPWTSLPDLDETLDALRELAKT